MDQTTESPSNVAELLCESEACIVDTPLSGTSSRSDDVQSIPYRRLATSQFLRLQPQSLAETKLSDNQVESLLLKALIPRGAATGRQLAEQLKLPFGILQQLLERLKSAMLVEYKAAAPLGDYTYELSQTRLEPARRYNDAAQPQPNVGQVCNLPEMPFTRQVTNLPHENSRKKTTNHEVVIRTMHVLWCRSRLGDFGYKTIRKGRATLS